MDEEFVEIPDLIAGFSVHEMARDFPPMTEDAFEELKESLQKHGQKEPIQVWEGSIIDGAHRALALEQLGKTPLINELECSKIDAVELSFILNADRRHLTTVQKAFAVIEHEKRMRSAIAYATLGDGRKKGRRPTGVSKPTRERLAKRVGTTARTVQKVAAITRRAVPDITLALASSRISIEDGQLISEMPLNEQYDALQKLLSSGRKKVEKETPDQVSGQSRTETFDALMTFLLEEYRHFDDVLPIVQRDPVAFKNEIDDIIGLLKEIREKALFVIASEVLTQAA